MPHHYLSDPSVLNSRDRLKARIQPAKGRMAEQPILQKKRAIHGPLIQPVPVHALPLGWRIRFWRWFVRIPVECPHGGVAITKDRLEEAREAVSYGCISAAVHNENPPDSVGDSL